MLTASVNWTELFGFVTGVLNVWLLARQAVWNWPIGLANNAAYLLLFAHSGLYGDAGLQLLYITLGVYGWWTWLHPAPGSLSLPVRRISPYTWKILAISSIVAAIALTFFLGRFTDSTVPAWDGLTTALSLAATWGQCRKLVESWWIWILADLIYIPLYVYKHLWLTAALYVVFLALCVVGLRAWTKELERELASEPSAA
jgi:nicotinamide mononucleotide transporter